MEALRDLDRSYAAVGENMGGGGRGRRERDRERERERGSEGKGYISVQAVTISSLHHELF